MWSHKVDLSLRDGSHSDLVKGPGEEGSESATEHDVPVPAAEANAHPTEVLLSDEALDVAIGERFLVGKREGRVLGVSIESDDAIERLPKFDKSISVRLACGNLNTKRNVKQSPLAGGNLGVGQTNAITTAWNFGN